MVYQQSPNYQGLYASQNDTSTNGFGNFATSYDHFTLGTGTTINQVTSVGGYYNPQSLGPISLWTVSFYANNSGQPGTLLQAFTIAGNEGETFLQNDVLGDPNYGYTAAVSFGAAAGTTYWLSVEPNLVDPPHSGAGGVHRRATASRTQTISALCRRIQLIWRSHCISRNEPQRSSGT